MRTVKQTVYRFDELDEETQEKVLDRHRFDEVEHDLWYVAVLEQYKEKLSAVGYEDAEIFFSGFGSQGDGASFDATVHLDVLMKSEGLDKKYPQIYRKAQDGDMGAYIAKGDMASHYCHMYTRKLYIDGETVDGCDELEKILENQRQQWCREIYDALQKEHDYLTSDEALREMIEVNELEFHKDGTLFISR